MDLFSTVIHWEKKNFSVLKTIIDLYIFDYQ